MRRRQNRVNVWPAITDLMTTIVVIAIIGGVLGYSTFNKIKEDLEDEISVLEDSISVLGPDSIHVELTQRRNQILGTLKNRLKGSGMSVEIPEEGVLRLSEDAINFALGDEKPIPRHESNIGWLARALAELVPCHISSNGTNIRQGNNDVKYARPPYCQEPARNRKCEEKITSRWLLGTILIEGHTDSVAVGLGRRFKNNLELSSMRAASVYEMITACEPSLKGMNNTQGVPVFSTSGYGEMRPAIRNDPGNDYNRRIDLRLLFELSDED